MTCRNDLGSARQFRGKMSSTRLFIRKSCRRITSLVNDACRSRNACFMSAGQPLATDRPPANNLEVYSSPLHAAQDAGWAFNVWQVSLLWGGMPVSFWARPPKHSVSDLSSPDCNTKGLSDRSCTTQRNEWRASFELASAMELLVMPLQSIDQNRVLWSSSSKGI